MPTSEYSSFTLYSSDIGIEELMTALDAKVATFIGDLVVTSPNEDYVPEVLTGTTKVQL